MTLFRMIYTNKKKLKIDYLIIYYLSYLFKPIPNREYYFSRYYFSSRGYVFHRYRQFNGGIDNISNISSAITVKLTLEVFFFNIESAYANANKI
ncbi:hypothetical protein Glove_82g50 [Diversispora epigaea]|uniref:Uncharacterized protein n=1 Tax=Diversispora epigaea TaxID=1348612 RepID=A0A397J8P1_9GLOM|nr:hypothetical protein Glove_82g50 [Diversispora epigaea]